MGTKMVLEKKRRTFSRAYCGSARTYFVTCAKVDSVCQSIDQLEETIAPAPVVLDAACPACASHASESNIARMRGSAKRVFDLIVATVSLVVFSPVMLAIAAAIRMTSAGPVIYRQERVGKDARVFTMYKFRTMYVDAEDKSGPVWARKQDPRVTPLGRFLRLAHLDELPQLFNVCAGDMSIVGPRPERPFFVAQLHSQIPEYHKRLLVKPGITGLAQVRHSYDATLTDVKKKIRYDLAYIKKQSFLLDVKVMVWTLGVMATGKGAH